MAELDLEALRQALTFEGRPVRAVRVTVEGAGVHSIEPSWWSSILAALERIPELEGALAQANALLRVHKGTSERLAARVERMEERVERANAMCYRSSACGAMLRDALAAVRSEATT